jgi:hypothetical protein
VSGKIAMVKYYSESNSPKFEALLKIPVSDRLPELTKKLGIKDMGKILMAEITKFQNCYNVVRPMNPDQIAQCAYSLIQTAEEDYLSLEDVILFLEGAKQGKYGKVYDRLDQQIIFEMMEQYRDERHRTFMRFKEEQHAQNKTAKVNDRFVSDAINEEENKYRSAFSNYMREQYSEEKQNRA